MLAQSYIQHIFAQSGAILTNGHFVYKSGKHGSDYVNKDAIYVHPRDVTVLCAQFANHVENERREVDTVIGPALGGIALSQWTGHHLMKRSVFAEKESNAEGAPFVIRRGYDAHITGKNVLVVEDILTTGASAKGVVDAVRAIGGTVIGVAALCNRGGVTRAALGLEENDLFVALVNLAFPQYDAATCPLCAKGEPINTTYGHGKKFLAARNAL